MEGLKITRGLKKIEDYYGDLAKFGKYELVLEGDYGYEYERRHWVILWCKSHPTAYIEVKDDDYVAKAEITDKYQCRYDLFTGLVHGGPTYYGRAGWNEDDKRTYIGWDYAHIGDRVVGMDQTIDDMPEKEWATVEILMDIARAYVGFIYQNDEHSEPITWP